MCRGWSSSIDFSSLEVTIAINSFLRQRRLQVTGQSSTSSELRFHLSHTLLYLSNGLLLLSSQPSPHPLSSTHLQFHNGCDNYTPSYYIEFFFSVPIIFLQNYLIDNFQDIFSTSGHHFWNAVRVTSSNRDRKWLL